MTDPLPRLIQYRLCPASRTVRLALAECGIAVDLADERPWEYRPAFLAINPAGELPVLEIGRALTLCGVYAISEYLAEDTHLNRDGGSGLILFPGGIEERAEVRRLSDWASGKLNREVTRELLTEKVYANTLPGSGRFPDPDVLRAIRANLRYHLSYIGFLAHQRRWIAGDEASLADLALAAHLSVIDYLGEVPWDEYPQTKAWYARLKSRPSFRALLSERIAGLPPPPHYVDLDF